MAWERIVSYVLSHTELNLKSHGMEQDYQFCTLTHRVKLKEAWHGMEWDGQFCTLTHRVKLKGAWYGTGWSVLYSHTQS